MDKTHRRSSKKDERRPKKTSKKLAASPDENYSLKSIFSLMLIGIMPNFVMVLNYIVRKCDSSYLGFLQVCKEKPILELFQEIWLKDEFDFKFGISIILGYSVFALILMIVVPGKVFHGPVTPKGNVPKYKDNGFACYILSLLSFGLLNYGLSAWSQYSVSIVYVKFPTILACLSIFSLGFCFLLYLKGLYFPSCPDRSISGYFFFDYYWGIELHPRIKGLDVKVFTNCRFGMTVWALLILCYLKYSIEVGSVHGGLIVNVILQQLYIMKFFWWESGYYNTLDIILDHAGFYICWGCIVYIPGLYTLSSYYMATQKTTMSNAYYIYILVIGITSLIVNYWADYQKQIARETNGKCVIWNKPAKTIAAQYVDQNGTLKKSILVISGFWGLARHFHYLPELSLAFCWCAASGFYHLMPFSYFVFLFLLLVHRVERDDHKCTTKYGKYYEQYKNTVPWKIIPYLY